jgi:hypothetical protein
MDLPKSRVSTHYHPADENGLMQGSADTGRIPYSVTLSGAKGLRQHAEEILRFAQNDRRPVSGFLTAKDRLTLTGIRGP